MISSPPRALLVDDNPADLYLHSLTLRESELFGEVIAFEEPDKALEFLRQDEEAGTTTAIVLDVNMPRMNAFQFLSAFDQLPETRRQRCVISVVTTSDDTLEAAQALSHPQVASFGAKPLTFNALALLWDRLRAEGVDAAPDRSL